MGRASDLREVLITEALGDFVKVLDRIEAVRPKLEQATGRMERAATGMVEGFGPFRRLLGETVMKRQEQAMSAITLSADQSAVAAFHVQTRAMEEAARTIFTEEVTPPLRELTDQLQFAIRSSRRPWEWWLTHAATAIASALVSASLVLFLTPATTVRIEGPVSAESPGPASAAPLPERAPSPAPAIPLPERPRVRK